MFERHRYVPGLYDGGTKLDRLARIISSFDSPWPREREREEMGSALESTDVKNKLEDLSGITLKPGENPYNALIETCNDDHVKWFPLPLKRS